MSLSIPPPVTFSRLQEISQKLKAVQHSIDLDEHLASDIHELVQHASDSFFRSFYSEQVKMQNGVSKGVDFVPILLGETLLSILTTSKV